MTKKPAAERAARALCTLGGHSENIAFEGAPMWKSYLPEVRAVLEAMKEPGMEHGEEWTRIIAAILDQTR